MEYLGEHLDGEPLLCMQTLRANRPSAALNAARRLRGLAWCPGPPVLDRLSDARMADMVQACVPEAGPEPLRRVQASVKECRCWWKTCWPRPGCRTRSPRRSASGWPGSAHRNVRRPGRGLLGRHFDWELLADVSGQSADLGRDARAGGRAVAGERGRRGLPLSPRADPRRGARHHAAAPQRALAAMALAVLDTAHPAWKVTGASWPSTWPTGPAAPRAGLLLSESGAQALAWGALATATGTLRPGRGPARTGLPSGREELARWNPWPWPGRVEEAAAAGGQSSPGSAREGRENGAPRSTCG